LVPFDGRRLHSCKDTHNLPDIILKLLIPIPDSISLVILCLGDTKCKVF
jgi:hypothetical protein